MTQADAQKQVLFGLYDLRVEASDAMFSEPLVTELEKLRLRFLDEFEAVFPGQAEGRSGWR